MEYKAAIFDLDGTLLDTMPIWSNMCHNFLLQYGIDEKVDLDNKLAVLSMRNALAYLLEHYPIEADLDEACVQTWQIVENFYREKAELKSGMREILDRLAEKNIPSGIITATEVELVNIALKRVGLEDYFAGGVMSCVALQTSKRSPEVFFSMADKLGASPEQTIVFEDALYAGRTAKLAGFSLAAIFDPSEKRSGELAELADWYCHTWHDFPVEIL